MGLCGAGGLGPWWCGSLVVSVGGGQLEGLGQLQPAGVSGGPSAVADLATYLPPP